jgi:arylsulfatase A-like enzyme
MSSRDHRLVKAAYWAMIDLIDVQMGRLILVLNETDQLDNTLIIFTSDHGELLGDHSIYLKGPYFYEPAIRVPMIFSMPGIVMRGKRSSALVELIDIPETILSAAGLKQPEQMQGISLWKLLTGQADLETFRESIYCEYYNALGNHKNPQAYATMVRTTRFKMVRYHNLNQGELYDLENDPGEFINHWDNPEYQHNKIQMFNVLCDRMAFTVDPLPPRVAGA